MSMGTTRGKRHSQINITPYIDILLVLLIIFMVIQPTPRKELQTQVPREVEKPFAYSPAIVLSIHESGEISINKKRVFIDELASELRDLYAKRVNKNMFLQANRRLPYGDVARIIDIAKGSGVGDIGLLVHEIQ